MTYNVENVDYILYNTFVIYAVYLAAAEYFLSVYVHKLK